MGERQINVADLVTALVDDLTHGTTKAAKPIRDILDAAYDGNVLTERISDMALGEFEKVWGAATAITGAKMSGLTLTGED